VLEGVVLAGGGQRASDAAHAWGRSPQASAQLVGALDAAKMDYAQRLLEALPPELRAALRQPEGARAAVIALLLAQDAEVQRVQFAAAGPLAEAARALAPRLGRLGAGFHLSLLDLAVPALKQGDAAGQARFLGTLQAVIQADRRVSLHEFVVLTLLRSQLAPAPRPAGRAMLAGRRAAAVALLSLVAQAGGGDAAAAFRAGARQIGLDDAAPLERAALGLDQAHAALEALASLAPLEKARLVQGLFAAATADGTIRLGEAELLRLVGAVLDCPLPPLIEALDPAAIAA
jgi:hypothetical protein